MLVRKLWYNVAAANPRFWERMPAAACLAQLTGGRTMAYADAVRWRPILHPASQRGVICNFEDPNITSSVDCPPINAAVVVFAWVMN